VRRALTIAAVVTVVVAGAAFLRGYLATRRPVSGEPLVADAAWPVAMVTLPDGGLLYGERLTGRIRKVDAHGQLRPRPLARVDVSTEGQRGLLGLAVRGGRVFASWTRGDKKLVVARVRPSPQKLVWRGPASSVRANGGRIAFAPDGELVIGVGDLEKPGRVPDQSTPNGKILTLEPEGPPDQRPRIVSTGWNNPFAFAFTPDGSLWVADNAPGSEPERLARGDIGGRPSAVTEFVEGTIVPAGLAAVSNDRLALCGFVSRTLQLYQVEASGQASPVGNPVAENCSIGVVRAKNGRLLYANENAIFTVRP
jgi:hypothetical protein